MSDLNGQIENIEKYLTTMEVWITCNFNLLKIHLENQVMHLLSINLNMGSFCICIYWNLLILTFIFRQWTLSFSAKKKKSGIRVPANTVQLWFVFFFNSLSYSVTYFIWLFDISINTVKSVIVLSYWLLSAKFLYLSLQSRSEVYTHLSWTWKSRQNWAFDHFEWLYIIHL